MFRRVSRCVRGSRLEWRVYPPRGYSAHTGRTSRRHKNGEYAAVTRGRPAFHSTKRTPRVVITTPTQKCRKNAKREFLSPPPTGFPPKPSEAVSVGRGRATERASPGRLRRDEGFVVRSVRRPASHLSGLRRSRCPAKRTGRDKALHPNSGQKPGPTFSYDWRKT